MFESYLESGVDGVLIVPCGTAEVVDTIKKANEKDVPVICLDTNADEDVYKRQDQTRDVFRRVSGFFTATAARQNADHHILTVLRTAWVRYRLYNNPEQR